MAGLVVALAGRRIDAPDRETRFPFSAITSVSDLIRDFLLERGASVLVCSAACGADLLALQAAGELGLRRRVILPYEPARFRAMSVADRPGEWATIYDQLIAELPREDIILLGLKEDATTYRRTNEAILDHALLLAGGTHAVMAVIVWNGPKAGETDFTANFADSARVRGIPVHPIMTTIGPPV